MNASNYLEEKLLDYIFKGESFDITNAYLGLVSSTATTTDLEQGDLTNEISGYTGDRKDVLNANFMSAYQDSEEGTTKNQNVIDFEDMPNEEVQYLIVCDSQTPGSGNILMWSEAPTLRTPENGDTYRIIEEGFTIKIY